MDINQNHTTMGSSDPSPLSVSKVQSTIHHRPVQTTETKARKKCHGNKKLQSFRKRRRARGMSDVAINKMIEARKREKEKQEVKKQQRTTTSTIPMQQIETITTTAVILKPPKAANNQIKQVLVASSTKRKRDVSSQEFDRHSVVLSHNQIAVIQQPSRAKKMKKSKTFSQSISSNSISVNKNYPPPPYLIQLSHLIFQALSQQLNCPLNKKDQQIFVHLRLKLFDRQCRLDIDQRLWQSYLNLGCKEKLWPHQLYVMAKTDQPEICKQFVMTQLTNIKHQLDQCNMELIRQTQSSILVMLPSVEILDSCLKEYVYLQQNYLFKRIDNQLIQYKDDICDQKLYHQLSTYHLTAVQQQAIQQLIHLRQVQLEVYEELIMLKERILHQFLLSNFDRLEQYIAQDFYWSSIADRTLVGLKTKHRKILQQGKRTLLHIYVYAYRFKINDYQQQYQQVLDEFELNFGSGTIIMNGLTLFHAVKAYMIHRTDRT